MKLSTLSILNIGLTLFSISNLGMAGPGSEYCSDALAKLSEFGSYSFSRPTPSLSGITDGFSSISPSSTLPPAKFESVWERHTDAVDGLRRKVLAQSSNADLKRKIEAAGSHADVIKMIYDAPTRALDISRIARSMKIFDHNQMQSIHAAALKVEQGLPVKTARANEAATNSKSSGKSESEQQERSSSLAAVAKLRRELELRYLPPAGPSGDEHRQLMQGAIDQAMLPIEQMARGEIKPVATDTRSEAPHTYPALMHEKEIDVTPSSYTKIREIFMRDYRSNWAVSFYEKYFSTFFADRKGPILFDESGSTAGANTLTPEKRDQILKLWDAATRRRSTQEVLSGTGPSAETHNFVVFDEATTVNPNGISPKDAAKVREIWRTVSGNTPIDTNGRATIPPGANPSVPRNRPELLALLDQIWKASAGDRALKPQEKSPIAHSDGLQTLAESVEQLAPEKAGPSKPADDSIPTPQSPLLGEALLKDLLKPGNNIEKPRVEYYAVPNAAALKMLLVALMDPKRQDRKAKEPHSLVVFDEARTSNPANVDPKTMENARALWKAASSNGEGKYDELVGNPNSSVEADGKSAAKPKVLSNEEYLQLLFKGPVRSGLTGQPLFIENGRPSAKTESQKPNQNSPIEIQAEKPVPKKTRVLDLLRGAVNWVRERLAGVKITEIGRRKED